MGDPDESDTLPSSAVEIVHARVARHDGVGAHQTDVPWGGGIGKGEDELVPGGSGRVEGTRRGMDECGSLGRTDSLAGEAAESLGDDGDFFGPNATATTPTVTRISPC